MAEFLSAFIPTVAFMLVPLLIPVVAITVGAVSNRLRMSRREETTASQARSRIAQREAARDLAQAA